MVVTPIARPVVLLPTPAVNLVDVDNEAMAAIGQGVVVKAPCVALEVVAAEHKHIKMIRNSKFLLQQTEP
jgi:hypothetical protein